MNTPRGLRRLKALICLLTWSALLGAQTENPAETSSAQPKYGPGGSQYSHGNAKVTHFPPGSALGFSVYEPASPTPRSAPVLVYLMADTKGIAVPSSLVAPIYDPMFRHLARKGYVVIFPSSDFAGGRGHLLERAPQKILETVRYALEQQKRSSVVPAADSKGVLWAIGGHSRGGLYSLLAADRVAQLGIPAPRAVILHEANTPETIRPICDAIPESYDACGFDFPKRFSGIPPSTRLLMIRSLENEAAAQGAEDLLPYTRFSVYGYADVWRRTLVTERNLHFFYVRRDRLLESAHVSVASSALALSPFLEWLTRTLLGGSVSAPDRTDWNGYWRPTVATLDTAFGKTASAVYLNEYSPLATEMGFWEDGRPGLPLLTQKDFPNYFVRQMPALPGAAISITPSFPRIKLEGHDPVKVSLRNEGIQAAENVLLKLAGEGIEYVVPPSCPTEFQDHDACEFEIRYVGRSNGVFSGRLTVTYEAEGRARSISREILANVR